MKKKKSLALTFLRAKPRRRVEKLVGVSKLIGPADVRVRDASDIMQVAPHIIIQRDTRV